MKLTQEQKQTIIEAIIQAEAETRGELRVHLSYAKFEENALHSARAQFEKLKMHLTEERNGMLLYLNPVLRKFSVFGDEGIHAKVGQDFWNTLSEEVSASIKHTDMAHGIVHAVNRMGHALKSHFPHRDGQKNELEDDISESD